jgi:hypothetical protein
MTGFDIPSWLPFLAPLIVLQIVLLVYAIRHILTHSSYKRGSRALWLVVSIVGMTLIGPILYILLGKEDA